LIQDFAVLRGEAEVDQCVPVADQLLGRYGAGGVINSLEHPGLNRCLDVGLEGCRRYVGYGVMSYNLHVIGREWLRRERERGQPLALAA
jgi:hypothetical protein